MKSAILGITLIVIGCAAIIYRARFAQDTVKQQNKIFGFHFGKKEIKANTLLNIVGGIILITVGVLTMLGIFEFK